MWIAAGAPAPVDQPVENPSLLDHAAESERRHDQPDRIQHAFHATTGKELVDGRVACL